MEYNARLDLAFAYNILARFSFNEGICNHLTMLIPGTSYQFLCIPYGMLWSEVTPESLLLIDSDGTILKGTGEYEKTAFCIHKAIHLTNPEKNIVCLHTHQLNATALCCLENGRLEMCHQNCLRFYDDISYDDTFNGLVLDEDEGQRIANVINNKRVLFHTNHGIIINGQTMAQALDDIIYLEKACEVQIKAMSTGFRLKIIPDKIAQEFKRCFDKDGGYWAHKHFEALKRHYIK
tara:strand:+ start:5241 stop:5945 length:705 start_codon:yes stop_codon:yes gene_type:complete